VLFEKKRKKKISLSNSSAPKVIVREKFKLETQAGKDLPVGEMHGPEHH
jgi:hypothetical protein